MEKTKLSGDGISAAAGKSEKKLSIALLAVKIIAVLIIGLAITWGTKHFTYFEHREKSVEYGIWEGFPFGYHYEGYYVVWGDSSKGEKIADWNSVERWSYGAFAGNFIIFSVFTGGVLFFIEKGLKKLLHITW